MPAGTALQQPNQQTPEISLVLRVDYSGRSGGHSDQEPLKGRRFHQIGAHKHTVSSAWLEKVATVPIAVLTDSTLLFTNRLITDQMWNTLCKQDWGVAAEEVQAPHTLDTPVVARMPLVRRNSLLVALLNTQIIICRRLPDTARCSCYSTMDRVRKVRAVQW